LDYSPTPPLLPRLLTKLAPPRFKKNMLSRERLIQFFVENLDAKLVIITAPAGYGKTTLLADYANRHLRPCVWLTFDESDRDPAIFVENLVLSISRAFPEFNAQSQFVSGLIEALRNPASGLEVCSRLLVNQIYSIIPCSFDLVLDDYHIVEEQPQLNALVSFFLNYLPDNCRVLLSCRAVAALELTQLVLQGDVVGIGLNELKMTSDEVYKLITKHHNQPITEKSAEELTTHCEGWITGILLDGSSIFQQLKFNKEFIRQNGQREQLFSYIASQTLQRLPGELQTFLLESSVLEYMQANLCNQLLGIKDSAEKLRECERRRLFISSLEGDYTGKTAEQSQTYYRYHNLFRDFLITRLSVYQPKRYHELERTCAELFKKEGDIVQAVSHYAKAGDYEAMVATLLEVSANEIKAGHGETLKSWLDLLPTPLLETQPELQIIKVQVLGLSGSFAEAHSLIDRMQLYLESQLPATRLKLAQAILMRGRLLRMETRYEQSITALEQVVELLNELEISDKEAITLSSFIPTKAATLLELGMCAGMNGQFSEALKVLFQAQVAFEGLGLKEELAQVHHCLSLAYTGLGDNLKRRQHLEISLKYWKEANNLFGQVKALINLAALYLGSEDYYQADQTLNQALERAEKGSYLSGQAHVRLYQANLLRYTNRFRAAYELYLEAQKLAERANEKRLVILIQSDIVSVLRALGDYPQAQTALEQGLQALALQPGSGSLLTNLLYLAQVGLDLDLGRYEEAQKLLELCSQYFTLKEHKREVAIKRFLEARLFFGQGRHKPALEAITESLNFCNELNNRQVLYYEALHAEPLLKFAQTRLSRQPLLPEMLTHLLKRLPKIEPNTPPVKENQFNSNNKFQNSQNKLEGSPNDHPLMLYGLGVGQVLVHGVKINEWRTAKAAELLFLLADRARPLHKEVIVEALWPDLPEAQSDSLIKSTVYRLRNALSPDWVKWERGAYSLALDYWYDVNEFEKAVRRAYKAVATNQLADQHKALEAFNYAIQLYRGNFLEGIYSEWSQERNENLVSLFMETLLKKAELEFNLSLNEASLITVSRCLELDKSNESAHLLRLRTHHRLSDSTLLRQNYQLYCHIVAQELNLKPSPEITSFYLNSQKELAE